MRRAIPILALFASAVGLPMAAGQTPDVASPLVSYQFLDSLGDVPDQPNVVSPLVSYQYFDWLGDENLTFEFSPVASYYFGGGVSLSLTGMVRDPAGTPVSGAEVILQRYNTVFWHGYTAADGTIPAPNLPSGNFNVVVIKAGYTSLFQSVPGDAGGPVVLNLTMHSAIDLPDMVTVSRTPEATAIRSMDPEPVPGVRAVNLRVFNGSAFSPTGTIRADRMTIVITHGWLSSLDVWATQTAGFVLNKHSLGANVPNIIGWDWRAKALTVTPETDEAAIQGEHLGKALILELGTGYGQRIHFIGHSLGTIVNSYACDYLHGKLPRQTSGFWDETETMPHVTLLDQAEMANVFGSNVATSSASGWFDSQTRSQLFDIVNGSSSGDSGFKSPFPKSARWMDNYISLVGLYHRDAVNVYMPAGVDTLGGAHADAHQWYRQSIQQTSPLHTMGFNRAYERSLVFPPSGNGMSGGSVWTSVPETADLFDLNRVENPGPFVIHSTLLRAATVVTGTTGGTLEAGGTAVLKGYETTLKWVTDLGGSAIQTTGSVISSSTEKIGNLWDAALDKASAINPDTLFAGSIGRPSLKLLLNTQTQVPAPFSGEFRSLNSSSEVEPPQAWVPVTIPPDAAFLVFDFTVTGDPAEDQIVCAINEQNLFTLPARFAPDGSPESTDFLDISAYAGQEVELYFGLVGGTSSGCALAIDGIRFVTVPLPKLSATVTGDQVRLNWPVAATGWIPQRNPGLAPEGWEDVALPETITTADGVVTLDTPRSLPREFFRLRRVE